MSPEEPEDITLEDDAIRSWGAAALGVDPLEASFTSEPYAPVRPHVPFYRFTSYPDVLELRHLGYELNKFASLFDQLENVLLSDALTLSAMLRNPPAAGIWNSARARMSELMIWQQLHRYGFGRLPRLIRIILNHAFPGDTANWLARDLTQLFYWAALAQVANDLAWRAPALTEAADYLSLPIRIVLDTVDLTDKKHGQ